MATDLMLWCSGHEPVAPAPGKDDFHMETVCTLVNIIGNAARSSVKVLSQCSPPFLRVSLIIACNICVSIGQRSRCSKFNLD